MQKIREDFQNGVIDERQHNRDIVSAISDYTRNMQMVNTREDKMNLHKWAQTELPKIIEKKARGKSIAEGDITTPLNDQEVDDLAGKVNAQIKKAIAKRLDVLQEYINGRYLSRSRPWNTTPEEWRDDMDIDEKIAYITQAYSHEMIRGNNGRLYGAFADVESDNGNGFEINVQFYEVDEDGNKIRFAGESRRELNVSRGYVYNASMFLDQSPVDRGAGIQTIYNQHAFMYLNSIGVTKAKVSTASDGPYVWARIGFVQENPIQGYQMENMKKALDRFKEIGGAGIIQNVGEYRRIEALVKKWARDGSVTHQDFIFAFDDNGDKFRALRIKEFFKNQFGLGSGVLEFDTNEVSRNPGERARELMETIAARG